MTALNLTGYTLTFDDEFNNLSVSQTGAGTTFADIRPEWRADANSDVGFGNSSFVDAASGYNPFNDQNGVLSVTAAPPGQTQFGVPGNWDSGLLSTEGNFSQTYGYFQITANFSGQPGAWDGFWLLPDKQIPDPNNAGGWQELDVVEHYGDSPPSVFSTVHTTDPLPPGETWQQATQVYSQTSQPGGFNTYGMDWEPNTITFYVNGQETGSIPTPSDMHSPMYMLYDLAVQNSQNPANEPITSYIKSIQAYASPNTIPGVDTGAGGAAVAGGATGTGGQAGADTGTPPVVAAAGDPATPPATDAGTGGQTQADTGTPPVVAAAGDPVTPPATDAGTSGQTGANAGTPPVVAAGGDPGAGTVTPPATDAGTGGQTGAGSAGTPPIMAAGGDPGAGAVTPPATDTGTGGQTGADAGTPPVVAAGGDPGAGTVTPPATDTGTGGQTGADAGTPPVVAAGGDPGAGAVTPPPATPAIMAAGADQGAADTPALTMATLPTTVHDDALALSTDLAQAGVVFNDATRLLEGGLWSTPADSNHQVAYLGMFTTDIHAVLNDVNAALANPNGVTVSGNAYTLSATDTAVLQQVQGQLQTLLTEAPQSIGNSANAIAAQELIHTTQTSILNEINSDSALATALAANPYPTGTAANNVGFEALPTGADDAASLAAAAAPGATLAQIGSVFNAAADLAVGGLNSTNLGQFDADMKAIAAGLTNLVTNPTALNAIEAGEDGTAAALTTIHLQTVLNQINLQINDFDAKYATDPNIAARSTNDNLLDIIDIVQNDTALNTAAGGNGHPGTVGGFAEFPAYLNGPDGPNAHGGTITQYQDDQTQTNFWAQFIAEANTVNNQLINVANGNNTTPGELQALITEIQNYNTFGASFDQAEGGVFGARFDNELLGGTLLTDTNAAVHGLTGIMNGDTGAALATDQAQIQAAGMGFVADANDVSGNNIPLGGGSYVGTSMTVAGATSVAGVAQGTIPVDGTAAGTASASVAQAGVQTDGQGGQAGQVAQGGGGGQGDPDGGQAAINGNGGDHHWWRGAGATHQDAGQVAINGNGGGHDCCGSNATDPNGSHQDAGNGTSVTSAGHSGMSNDIAALLQALQQGNTNAVNDAVGALGTDVHAASAGEITNLVHNLRFDHMWHHA
jgi:Glycosyl hydrolases family 16